MTETSKSRPVPKTDMRPNIEISHALNGRVKDYAAENDMTTSEAYAEIIVAGLESVDESSDTGGMVGGEERDEQTNTRARNGQTHASHDETQAVVDEVSATWEDDGRLEDRRQAARAAVDLLLERGQLGKQDAIAQLLPKHAVAGQDDKTWWRRNCREVVSHLGTYSKAKQAYVLDE